MKTGRSIQDIAVELKRQLDSKADFIVDTRQLSLASVTPLGDRLDNSMLSVAEIDDFWVTDYTHGQIASRLQIPKQYYDRIKGSHPALLDVTVNTLMYDKPERRMVRTLDGHARAFLSDRYRRIDNWDLMEVVLPILMEQPEMNIVSAEVTDKRLYIKAVFPRITTEVKRGDPIQAGIVISNSEIGAGALDVSPLIYRLVCLNGMISAEGVKKYHLGKRQEEADHLFTDETKAADDRALWLKVRDVVKATVDETTFNAIALRLQESTERKLNIGPIEAVEQLSNKTALTQDESDSVLKYLIEGGDLSQYGMIQAVTRMSQDADDYDRATELEQLGGSLLDADRKFLSEIGIAA